MCSRAGVCTHLKLDEEFVGAQREARGEEHGTLLFGDGLRTLPLTAFDFLQELRGERAGEQERAQMLRESSLSPRQPLREGSVTRSADTSPHSLSPGS